jgi:hypothetical protein
MLIDLPWNEKSDSTWYYDQKKSYICYDVWLILMRLLELT